MQDMEHIHLPDVEGVKSGSSLHNGRVNERVFPDPCTHVQEDDSIHLRVHVCVQWTHSLCIGHHISTTEDGWDHLHLDWCG